MSECFRCGISSEKAKLYDVLSNRGVVKLCDNCNHIEKLPVIRRPSEEEILDSKNPRSKSVRDRLESMNKIKVPHKEVTLRTLIDKDYNSKRVQPPSDLISNFNWAIQRMRRHRRITRQEFAKGIGESEATVRMIEQGYLPDSSYKIINKIEGYFGVSLRKTDSSGFSSVGKPKEFVFDESLSEREKEQPGKKLNFEKEEVKKLTIRDLLGIKKKKEDKEKNPQEENDYPQDDEQFLDEQEEFNEEDI